MRLLLFCMGIFAAFVANPANGAKILGLFAFPSQSHFNAIQPIMTGLANKNYNVTTVSSFRLGEKINYYEEIFVPAFDFWSNVQQELGTKTMFEFGQVSSSRMHKALSVASAALTDYFLQQPKLRELIESPESFDYDLIIVDLFYTEALLMIGEIFNKPTIVITSSNFENYITSLVDYLVPSACSPIDFQTKSQDANFFKRISNFFACIERRNQRKKNLLEQDNVAVKHFSKINRSLPSVSSLQERIAFILVNNYSPLLVSSPTLSNIIPVGGLHIKPTQNIQWNIKRFLDDARDGAIYLSLGTALKCSELPKNQLDAIITVLGKLKERILWHCDIVKMENLPKNILLQKIISSSDVLAHPHVRYFITSGGLLSLQEAIYRNIPILGIPALRDQELNIQTVENLGIGIRLDFFNLTEVSFAWSIDKLLSDPSYTTKIREISSIFRDRPLGSLQTSMFWIEYILRHKDVSHLRTVGTGISWFQLYLFDILIIFILCIIILLLIGYVFYILRKSMLKKREENKLYSKIR